MEKFRVISIFNNYSIIKNLVSKQIYLSTLSKNLHNIDKLVVGDLVEAIIYDNNREQASIIKILPRANYFQRPRIANVDEAIIISSVTNPKFDHFFVNKLIMNFELQNIKPHIVFTKTDLQEVDSKWVNIYTQLNYEIHFINLLNIKDESWKFIFNLSGTILLLGKSGVGKSTLINNFAKSSEELQMTGKISAKLKQGKNTTTNSKIIYLNEKSIIIDTPGFQNFFLNENVVENYYNGFNCFKEYANMCKFKNCSHTHEEDCAIKNAVSDKKIPKEFYDDYLKILDEKSIKNNT